MTDGAGELELLLEERAILRALHRYAHAMDSGDEAAWVDSFTPDAVFDVVEAVGGRRVHREEGHGDLAAYVAGYPKPPSFRKHVIVDPVIHVDGDEARVAAYWSAAGAATTTPARPASERSATTTTTW